MKRLELDFFLPPETVVVVDGEELRISPIRMAKVPVLLQLVRPVIDDLLRLIDTWSNESAISLAVDHADRVAQVVALCFDIELQAVQKMLPDRVAALLLVCCEVNYDFFGRAVQTMRAQSASLAPQLVARWAGALNLTPEPEPGRELSTT